MADARDQTADLAVAIYVHLGPTVDLRKADHGIALHETGPAGPFDNEPIAGRRMLIGDLDVAGKCAFHRSNAGLDFGEIPPIRLELERLASRNALLKKSWIAQGVKHAVAWRGN